VPAFWRIFVGVYAAACGHAKFFTSTVEGVALRAGYTDARPPGSKATGVTVDQCVAPAG
jgi:hypothetical protein